MYGQLIKITQKPTKNLATIQQIAYGMARALLLLHLATTSVKENTLKTPHRH